MTNEEFISSVSLPGEEWRDVIGFEGSYIVSNLGRIAIYPKLVGPNKRGTHLMKGRIITQHIQRGRPIAFLAKNGQPYKRFVENIVVGAFLPNEEGRSRIIHVDGDATNCTLLNLKRADVSMPTEPGEEWRDVVGYDGLYKISNFGRVYSTIGECNGPEVKQRGTPHFLNPYKVNRNGKYYYNITLSKNGKTAHKYLHRLIAEAFIPNPNDYNEIDHIDRDGTNNSIFNLKWCTHKQNLNNPNSRIALSDSRRGHPCPWNYVPVVQLKDGIVVKIYKSIASVKEDGFRPSAVSNCLTGKSKTHHGFHWIYLSGHKSQVGI